MTQEPWRFHPIFFTELRESQTRFVQGDYSALDTSWETDEIRLAAISYMVEKRDVPVHISCGFAANFDSEAGGKFYWDPKVLGDSGQALGLAQWHQDRQPALFAFAKELERDPHTRSLQIDFALQEVGMFPLGDALPGFLQRKKARGHILKSRTAHEAAAAISIYFEGPRDKLKEVVRRGWKATEFYSRWSMLPKPGEAPQIIELKFPEAPPPKART